MEKLTASQSIKIARDLKGIVRAIDEYQDNNWDDLTREQHIAINKAERDILFNVQDIIAQTMIILVEDSQEFIASINNVSVKIEQKLAQIDNINKVIEITTASVFLVSAIVSQNPSAIGMSIQGVVDTLT